MVIASLQLQANHLRTPTWVIAAHLTNRFDHFGIGGPGTRAGVVVRPELFVAVPFEVSKQALHRPHGHTELLRHLMGFTLVLPTAKKSFGEWEGQ
jgi:hypothetical protein